MSFRRQNRQLAGVARRRNEHGVALLSTLVTVIVLGVIAGVVVSESSHSKPGPSPTLNGPATTTTAPGIASEAQLAAVSGCETNFATIATAIQTYSAENGSPPPAGISWATASTRGGPFLQSWPTDSPYYAITWNGVSENVIPKKGITSRGTLGTSSPATGCYAS
ncbi:MAG: hypothetical protein JWM55_1739 [Acidimicrobiaceae bacterium]|nr:hypothetical protein [Acidimicrobiaceae bacterium]